MKGLFATALCLAALAAPARAEEPRKIDFTKILLDQDNRPLMECADLSDKECKVKRELTLGLAASRSLAFPEANISPEDALKRGQLALQVYQSNGAQLTADEISLIKRQIAKYYNPIVVVRAVALLDPAAVK